MLKYYVLNWIKWLLKYCYKFIFLRILTIKLLIRLFLNSLALRLFSIINRLNKWFFLILINQKIIINLDEYIKEVNISYLSK
jgi:hypothetical protein